MIPSFDVEGKTSKDSLSSGPGVGVAELHKGSKGDTVEGGGSEYGTGDMPPHTQVVCFLMKPALPLPTMQSWCVHLYAQFLGGITFQLCTYLDRRQLRSRLRFPLGFLILLWLFLECIS